MASIRIAHLSDLHASNGETDSMPIIVAAIEDLKGLHAEKSIDLVVISGDLSKEGKADDFRAAWERLIEPLREALGLGPERFVMVPGNHDVDRDLIDEYQEDGLRAALIESQAVESLLGDEPKLSAVTKRLEEWNSFYAEAMDGVEEERAGSLAYTRELEIGGVRIGIAALNSAWRSANSDDRHHLLIGGSQVKGAIERIEDCELRIVTVHHPLPWLADFDANAARDAFEGARTVVLSGHEHETDPTAEFSLRGAAVYSRAGCLYEDPKSINAYTLLDVDLERGAVDFKLRQWYPAPRNEFDAATGLAKGGEFEIEWGKGDNLPVPVDYSTVIDRLATQAADLCVLATVDRELEVSTPDDVLVEPRLWPLPYKEIAAARDVEGGTEELEPSDALESLDRSRVLMVVGEPESGVSAAILWILTRHFELHGTHTPVQVAVGKRLNERRFEKNLRHSLNAVGVSVEGGTKLPPALVAIDDLSPKSDLARLSKYVADNEQHLFLLGCHEDDAEDLRGALEAKGIEREELHLGPLGRAQVRALIEMSGGVPEQDVDRIFGLIVSQHLPRTPLIIAALIVVVADQQDPLSYNPSALLDGCVKVLLGFDIGEDPLEMDLRQREVLLSWLAGQMARDGARRLNPLEATEALTRYFRDRGLDQWQTPDQVIESHVRRSILVRDSEGIGFRHQAIMDLFAGKRITHEPEFAVEALESPLRYERPIGHAAGITRNSKEILGSIQGQSADFLSESGVDFNVELFDRIKDRQGWSEDDPDLEDLKKMISSSSEGEEEDESERDERLERYYDDVEYDEEDPDPPEQLRELGPYVSLLSSVLRNSELVADIELKERSLRDAIHGWSLIAIMMALEEDQSAEVRERMGSDVVAEMVESEVGEDSESLARVTELIIVMVMVITVTSSLASPHLESVAKAVLDDEEFMAPTAHALFATLFYVLMGFPDWSERLAKLYEAHSEHPIVKQLVISLALSRYRSPRISDADAAKLEGFIAGLVKDEASAGGDGPGAKIALDRRLQEIRLSRQKALMAGALKGEDEFADD